MADRPLYAVKVGENWHIARIVPASSYSQNGGDVWAEARTTAWLCRVGEEARSVLLTEELIP
jgi:hypothetical protein